LTDLSFHDAYERILRTAVADASGIEADIDALAMAFVSRSSLEEAKLIFLRAYAASAQGNYALVTSLADEAVSLFDPREDLILDGRLRLVRAICAVRAGDADEAFHLVQPILELPETPETLELRLNAMDSIAMTGMQFTHDPKAFELLQQVAERWREIGFAPGEARCLNNLAYGLITARRFEEALPIAERSEAVHIEFGIRHKLPFATSTLARVQSELGRYSDAIATFTRAKALALDPPNEFIQTGCIIDIAHAKFQRGDDLFADPAMLAELHACTCAGVPEQNVGAYKVLSRVYAKAGRFEEALRFSETSADLQLEFLQKSTSARAEFARQRALGAAERALKRSESRFRARGEWCRRGR